MRQTKRVLLVSTKIDSSSEYKSEAEISTGFIYFLYISSLSILLPLLLSTEFSSLYNNISQLDPI